MDLSIYDKGSLIPLPAGRIYLCSSDTEMLHLPVHRALWGISPRSRIHHCIPFEASTEADYARNFNPALHSTARTSS